MKRRVINSLLLMQGLAAWSQVIDFPLKASENQRYLVDQAVLGEKGKLPGN